MADHKYEIVIKYEEIPDGSDVGQAPLASPSVNQKKSSASSVAFASAIIVPTIQTALSNKSAEIRTVTGSDQLARRQEVINSAVNGAVTLAQSAMGGATVAASFGKTLGISTGSGAILGIVTAVMGKVLDIASRAEQLQNQMKVESTQIAVSRARAGISWNMSRSR